MNYSVGLSECGPGGYVRRLTPRRIFSVRILFHDPILLRGGILTMLFVCRQVAMRIIRLGRLSGIGSLTRSSRGGMLGLRNVPYHIAVGAGRN